MNRTDFIQHATISLFAANTESGEKDRHGRLTPHTDEQRAKIAADRAVILADALQIADEPAPAPPAPKGK